MGDKTSVRHSCTEAPTPYENNSISYQQSSPILEKNLKVHLNKTKDPPSSLITGNTTAPSKTQTTKKLNFSLGFHWPLTETTVVHAQCM